MKLSFLAVAGAACFVACSASQYNGDLFLRKMSDPNCRNFDNVTGQCSKCYTGYYLNHQGVCRKNRALCAECDKKGNCISCFKQYVLINGRCYHEGVLQRPRNKREGSDPLCTSWIHDKCQACVAGTYMNQKGICKLEDPNCQKYDYQQQLCIICMRGFKLNQNICQRSF